MTTFTNTFRFSAAYIYSTGDGWSTAGQLSLSLEDNKVFNRFLVTKLNNNRLEIPVIARGHIEGAIFNSLNPITGELSIQSVVLPLYENSISQTRKTFNKIVNEFFAETSYSARLLKITTSTGEVYYGGKGIILDSDYKPLVLCTLSGTLRVFNRHFNLVYDYPLIYVSPEVFMEPAKLINRGIIKTLIPYYTNNNVVYSGTTTSVYCSKLDGTIATNAAKKAIVVIKSPDWFFSRPTVPNPQRTTSDSLNVCLVDNVDDILGQL